MRAGWRAALGILISAVCLYFAFKNVEWQKTLDAARNTNYFLLVLGAACSTSCFALRARRWRTILDPVAPKLPFGPLWRATAIGAMITNVVPLRAGELARPYALTREVPAVSFSTGLASLVVDRVFDAIVVLLLLAVSIVASHFGADAKILGYSIGQVATAFAAAPVALLVVLYALVFFPTTLIRIFEMLARRVSPAVERRGSEMLRRFADGLSVLRTPGHFLAVFLWTLIHWLVQPLGFYLGFLAVGVHVPWVAALFVQGIIVIMVALPSAPGFVGLFELGGQIGLGMYGIAESTALTWAIVFHVASLIPITLIGAYYAAKAGFRVGDATAAGETT